MEKEAIVEAYSKAIAKAISVRERRRSTRATRSIYTPSRPSIRDLAAKYKVNKSSLGRHLKALHEGIPAESSRNAGRPPVLTYSKESAVVVYVVQLSRGNFPTYRAILVNAANTLRSKRIPPVSLVSKVWIARFLKQHLELRVATCRAKDIKRNAFELDSASVIEWFDHYDAV